MSGLALDSSDIVFDAHVWRGLKMGGFIVLNIWKEELILGVLWNR